MKMNNKVQSGHDFEIKQQDKSFCEESVPDTPTPVDKHRDFGVIKSNEKKCRINKMIYNNDESIGDDIKHDEIKEEKISSDNENEYN